MGAKATNPTGNEGTPEQAWSGVVRRRVTLPKALALALVPGLVFAVAAVSGVLVGISPDAALVATAFLLGAGAVAAMIAPIATRIEACEVTASRAGLRVGALWLPGEEITRGFLIPGDDLHGAVLRIERRGRPALHFDGSDPAVVSGLLRALGHDAGQRALQIGVLDRPHFYLGALGFIALMIFTGIVQQRLPPPFGTLLWAGVALGYLKRLPRRLIVAADGVTVEWLGGPQFISAARLRGATITYRKGRDGEPVVEGFFLHTEGRSTRLMIFGGLFWSGYRALKGRLDEASAVRDAASPEASALLPARGDDDVRTWVERLRAAGRGSEQVFRSAALDAASLGVTLENPALAPRERAAAAVALTAMEVDPSAARVRVAAAADGVADPDLREVFEGLAHDNDTRVVDAMRRLHWG